MAKISRLPAPWRETLIPFSVDNRQYLYMDERLVIPSKLRASIIISIHYGPPGRDTIMRFISDIWKPKIHREVITTAKCCDQYKSAGKNIRPSLRQSQFRTTPKSINSNKEISLDFCETILKGVTRKAILVGSHR